MKIAQIAALSESVPPRLYGGRALLFPIDWPEPFGLVMIEAMACDTPVVAFRAASMPEVIEDSVSGFIVRDIDQAVDAVLVWASSGSASAS